ncbi:hypothetical protein HC031_31675 [Planosporangium thailandense]|uniref:Glycoside hydrolase n=1 Tax=Planosporangium thailandense TaxID=765197 RepID=A0ABX0YA04_9ACTN|nr:GH25 family lysozyme [Planosporangium thailandense]NJC74240.1 hypothetical protein [Planosporangium thailandense]
MNKRTSRLRNCATAMVALVSVSAAILAGVAPATAKSGGAYVPGDGGSAHAGVDPGSGSTKAAPRAAASAAGPAGYSVTGIDVASWQGNIDWNRVAAAGTDFSYAKATEGTTYVNPYFDSQYRGAKRAGLYSGAYVFARPDSPDAVGQANYFIDHAQFALDGKTLPPMLDIEWPYKGSSGKYVAPYPCYGLDATAMVNWIRTFVNQVYVRTGKKMLIYTNPNWWNPCTNNTTAFSDQYLSVAAYRDTPPTYLPSGWSKWTVWQYADSGALPGDQDVFNGSPVDLAAFAAQAAPKFTAAGDFNGDGLDDVALFYDYGVGYVSLWTMNARKGGGFDPPVARWYAPLWGTGTRFISAGDFNGDGKADIALFYDYGGGSVRVFTLSANGNGDGGFAGPFIQWTGPVWGSGTRFISAGDFNGDGKADIALLYDYGAGHVAVFTLPASGGGGLAAPVLRWNGPVWGAGTRFISAGDFNGDGKADIALLYDYGAGHVAVFTLPAGGNGGLAAPVLRWNGPVWGGGTRLMSAGDFTHDTKSDLSLLYDYGRGHVSVFRLAASSTGNGSLAGPIQVWDGPSWGGGTKFMISGSYTGAATDDIGLFYDYGGGHQAMFTLSVAAGGHVGPSYAWDSAS